MNIVIAGHVDHGKSTITGRILADTNSLPEGKVESIRAYCEKNAKPFEWAFLLDALKDEQSQGITIDSARVFFKSKSRDYIIIDAPGHIEFLKNMVSGASRAEAALLVIDAKEGVQENSRRHSYMLSMLGISQISVVINKMDLVDYSKERYDRIVAEYDAFLGRIGIKPASYIPVSGREGDNIITLSKSMPWYSGDTILGALDGFRTKKSPEDLPFRMFVQGVYRFTEGDDDRRIVAGTVSSGVIRRGDEIVFYPSGKRSAVASIEAFNESQSDSAPAGKATGFTLKEQIYVQRGELAAVVRDRRPEITSNLLVNLFWLGRESLSLKKDYIFKIGTMRVNAKLDQIRRVLNASNLESHESRDTVERHEVAECVLKLSRPVAFDTTPDLEETTRFVIVDDYEIQGGGIIREALEDRVSWARDRIILRNYKWERSLIPPDHRSERYNQKSALILLTGAGADGDRKKEIAKEFEQRLFNEGKFVYFLGIGNILYGVDSDIKSEDPETKKRNRREHIRRLAEVAHILLDTGLILLVTAVDLTQEDLDLIKEIVDFDKIHTVWVGERVTTDIRSDVILHDESPHEGSERIKDLLKDRGVIFRAW